MSDYPTKILYIKTTMTELNKLIEKLNNDVNITNKSLETSINLIEKLKSEINITTIQTKKNELQDKIILELKKCIGIGPNKEELLYQKHTLSKELKIHSLNYTKIKEVIEKIEIEIEIEIDEKYKNLKLEFKTFEDNQINKKAKLKEQINNMSSLYNKVLFECSIQTYFNKYQALLESALKGNIIY
jgi:hypothetical protein